MSKLDASKFKSTTPEKETRFRVHNIMGYVTTCYNQMINDGMVYSKSESLNEAKTRNNLEEYLTEMFVIDYLEKGNNINNYFNSDTTGINHATTTIFFNYESKQTYNENGTRKDDYIDIKINDSVLSSIWGALEQQQIHMAIECKVIENGYSQYVTDIEKMCNRNYNTPRLPFEGQIGYIINPKYTHSSVAEGIKNALTNQVGTITTVSTLSPHIVHPDFKASYLSKHKRNYGTNDEFSIYHLLFDYSKIVVD